MFKFWFVDDKMHFGLQKAAEWSLGKYAEYETFRSANDPIDKCKAAAEARKADALPHVFAIDLNFDTARPKPPIDNISLHAVGFIVAAEYRHYARELNRSDVVDVLYTANYKVMEAYGDICSETPYGHDNLIKVVEKADVKEGDIMAWVRERCLELARQRLRSGKVSVCEQTVNELRRRHSDVQAAWKGCSEVVDVLSAPVRHILDRLADAWLDAVHGTPELSTDSVRAYGSVSRPKLRNGLPIPLRQAMQKCTGPIYETYKSDLENAVTRYDDQLRESGLVSRFSSALGDARGLLNGAREWTELAHLFPFHAQEIATAFTPSAAIETAHEILTVMEQELDHNRSIARIFKSMKVDPTDNKTRPTSIWAYACHGIYDCPDRPDWSEPNPGEPAWPYVGRVDIPQGDDDGMESLLEAEVGWKGKVLDGIVQISLPDRYLRWVRQMGNAENQNRMDRGEAGLPPFVSFVKCEDRIDLTCPVLSDYLKKGLDANDNQLEVVGAQHLNTSGKRVISDWAYLTDLFSSMTNAEKDLVKALDSLKISYLGDQESASVEIEVRYSLSKHLGPLRISFGSGGLTGRLASFLGWGELRVITNSMGEQWTCFWPGGQSEHHGVLQEDPFMTLILTMPNYLQRRCCLESRDL